jgi:hypothetical protein
VRMQLDCQKEITMVMAMLMKKLKEIHYGI